MNQDQTKLKGLIAYATKSGNSKQVAKSLHANLIKKGIEYPCKNISEVNLDELNQLDYFFVVTSTVGDGAPPTAAKPFFKELKQSSKRLESLNFAICALGDKSYKKFCEAGKTLENILVEKGANEAFKRADCDKKFSKTAAQWIDKVCLTMSSETPVTGDRMLEGIHLINPKEYKGTIETIKKISKGNVDKPCYHIEIRSDESLKEIKPGDSIEIVPSNPDQVINELAKKLGFDENSKDYQYFKHDAEITSVCLQTLKDYSVFSNNEALKSILKDNKKRSKLIAHANVLDLLIDYPCEITAQQLFDLLPRLKSRLYSVASYNRKKSKTIHLTVKNIRFDYNERSHAGAASTHITENFEVGSTFSFKHYPNPDFKIPNNDSPIIMIGIATGIAPFRAFLQQKNQEKLKNKCWLIWGDKHRKNDFIYEKELTKLQHQKTLNRLNTTFSRDGIRKEYVQDALLKHEKRFRKWIQKGAHVFVCGSISMSLDIREAINEILKPISLSLSQLEQQHHYHEEAY